MIPVPALVVLAVVLVGLDAAVSRFTGAVPIFGSWRVWVGIVGTVIIGVVWYSRAPQ